MCYLVHVAKIVFAIGLWIKIIFSWVAKMEQFLFTLTKISQHKLLKISLRKFCFVDCCILGNIRPPFIFALFNPIVKCWILYWMNFYFNHICRRVYIWANISLLVHWNGAKTYHVCSSLYLHKWKVCVFINQLKFMSFPLHSKLNQTFARYTLTGFL